VTGMRIVRALVEGERDPVVLARHRHPLVKSPEEAIAKALEGKFLPEQIFLLRQRQALEAYDFPIGRFEVCDGQIEAYMRTLKARTPLAAPSKPRLLDDASQEPVALRSARGAERITGVRPNPHPRHRRAHVSDSHRRVGVERVGLATEKHFVSWLALCPNHAITGGRIRRASRDQAPPGRHRLRIAAQTSTRADRLGRFYRACELVSGPPKPSQPPPASSPPPSTACSSTAKPSSNEARRPTSSSTRNACLANLKRSAKHLGFQLVAEPVS